jgi:biotin transport system substrate-specific component
MNMNANLLADRLWPAAGTGLLRNAVLAVAGSLLVALAAQVTVPMYPVPMTLQTLPVLAIGAAYGARLGGATLLLYMIEGAIGLPFFRGGKSGLQDDALAYWFPSGSMGYLVGFIVAAWLVGKLVESGWGETLWKTAAATVIGGIVLYVPGLIWLAIWAAKTQALDASAAIGASLSWGLYPFVIGDLLKAIVAGLTIPAVGALAGRKTETGPR